MDARMKYAHEILKREDQHSQLWMGQIPGNLDWDDSDPGIMRLSKPANKANNYVEAAASKNLHSERKRRKKLNDTLYTLRSVVPKISKMDKESIIGDAIGHVLDLQKKIQEIEGEILGLCNSNKGDDHTETRTDIKKPLIKPNLEKLCNESSDAKKLVDNFKPGKALETKFVEICKAGKDGMYHVRMECKRDAGVLVDLTRALESVPLEIVNSNMWRFHQATHCTFYVRSLKNVGADKLEDMIRQTIGSDYSSSIQSKISDG